MPAWSDLVSVEVSSRLSDLLSRWLRIDILVVTDTIVSFGPEHDPRNLNESFFGMSHLIGVLQGVGKVTKAHRGNDPLTAPDVIANFRFDTHDLSSYDQIWLLGHDTGQLPVSEQAAIATFMNDGGGVFATGDHADLGSLLAGALPRVRSMRHWQSPPPPLGPDRVDTVQPDANNIVVFENQSDDIPQVLQLRWYEWSRHAWYREIYPHPLLCSRSGPITEFPDHMHEGEIVVPTALDAQMTVGGLTFDEYPKDSNGVRVAPEVVAWGRSIGRADPEVMHGIHVGDPTPSTARWTGTIGVYDGHRANVGRVVVHSTWHHFFDINLIGDNAANRPGFSDPRAALWSQGFAASTNGQRILAQVDQYYRNIVHWLSPGLGSNFRFDALVVQLAINRHVREVIDGGVASPLAVGAYAWEYAIRLYPPCTTLELLLPPIYERIPIHIGPWPEPGPDNEWPIPPRQLAQAALGGALLALKEVQSIDELEAGRGSVRLRAGAVSAIHGLVEREIGRTEVDLQHLKRVSSARSDRR